MGDIAEMMLDGTMCECCGVFLHGPALGYPRYCSKQCAKDRGGREDFPKQTLRTRCIQCGKTVKAAGLRDHMRDVHKGETK